MEKLNIELCPETGICSIVKEGGKKVDMMPGEITALREAKGDTEQIKSILSTVDASFTNELDADDLEQIVKEL